MAKQQHRQHRKDIFNKVILPNKDKIILAYSKGSSERAIYDELGIQAKVWNEQKKKHPEMDEWLQQEHSKIVNDLKNALLKKAMGFQYEEKVQEIKQDLDENGKPIGRKYMQTRITTRYAEPDATAIFGCLKIYDKDKLMYDVQCQSIEIKKQELEIKKQESTTENSDLAEKLKDLKIEFVDGTKKESEK